jgi:hypothetical protein
MNTTGQIHRRPPTGPRRPRLPLYVRGVPATVWMAALVRVRAC